MKTVIMAGGKGTRISSITSEIPKPMIDIAGRTVLEREIECLRKQGLNNIIITVSHLSSIITNYFGDGTKFGVHIEYYMEDTPLGNAGALFKLREKFEGDFILINGDLVFDIDFDRFIGFHKRKKGLVTLFTHPNDHPFDSGVIVANDNNEVQEWMTKEENRPQWYKNRVNAGIHIINPAVLDLSGIDPNLIGTFVNGKSVKVDLDRDILKPLCCSGKMFCYDSPEYIHDMGTPERYYSVCEDIKKGIVKKKNLNNRQKAIFLDRDGTINKYVGFLKNLDDFELLPDVPEAIREINKSEYLVIVITNQPVVARGEVTRQELDVIHYKMETLLGREGAYIDALYYCPHHPDSGYIGEIKELKVKCECRKPKPGMFFQAADEFDIDLASSWMIGDGENDIEAGKAAGCKTALIGDAQYGQNISGSSVLQIVKCIFDIERGTSEENRV